MLNAVVEMTPVTCHSHQLTEDRMGEGEGRDRRKERKGRKEREEEEMGGTGGGGKREGREQGAVNVKSFW